MADEKELGLLFALRRRTPHFAYYCDAAAEDRDDEECGQVGEATLPALHHCEYSVPFRPLPSAPLLTSKTPICCASCGGTMIHVVGLSVMGSSGTRRRYLSATSDSSVSG